MSFALFFLAEYVNMVTVSAVATDLFLGGWHGPFLPEWLGWIWFLVKLFAMLFFYIWMRWTLPRYRYDQLMEFGWKYLLPLSVDQPPGHGRGGRVFQGSDAHGRALLLDSGGRRGRRLAAGHRAAQSDVQRPAAASCPSARCRACTSCSARRSWRSIQIIIYAGAIMVLFLFVVMLLNVPTEDAARARGRAGCRRAGPRHFGAVLAVRARRGAGLGAPPARRDAAARARARDDACMRSACGCSSDYGFAVRGDLGPDPRGDGRCDRAGAEGEMTPARAARSPECHA